MATNFDEQIIALLRSCVTNAGGVLTAVPVITNSSQQVVDLLSQLSGLVGGSSAIVGETRNFAMATLPAKWLACNGAAISRTTYAALFAVVSTTWGVGDGSTTFNLPDLRGRAVIGTGTGSSLTARSLGDTGGAETHTLTTAEMPAHTHGSYYQTTATNGSTANQVAGSGLTVPTTSTGGGGAHNNMQPFAVALAAIYAGV